MVESDRERVLRWLIIVLALVVGLALVAGIAVVISQQFIVSIEECEKMNGFGNCSAIASQVL